MVSSGQLGDRAYRENLRTIIVGAISVVTVVRTTAVISSSPRNNNRTHTAATAHLTKIPRPLNAATKNAVVVVIAVVSAALIAVAKTKRKIITIKIYEVIGP